MNPYEQRRAARVEKLREHVRNATVRAERASKKAHAIMDMIPLGQPILVGHHSEKHARRDRAKIDRGFEIAREETERAERNARKASAIESGRRVSGWDPDAAAKIQVRIDELEARRGRIKAVNAEVRRVGLAAADIPERAKLDLLHLHQLMPYHHADTRGFPAYELTNLGSNIRRLRERLVSLKRQAEQAPGAYVKVVPNKWRGRCERCGAQVEARAGFYASDAEGEAGVVCAPCMEQEKST